MASNNRRYANQNHEKKLVLCVGLLCVDTVNIVNTFPKEDLECKISDYYDQRGGNASNTSTVLSVLGRSCELLTVIAKNSPRYQFLVEDLKKYNINMDHCVLTNHDKGPHATILLSLETGSRTILSTKRQIPELTVDDFVPVLNKPDRYSWIHFEGRYNIKPICNMLETIDRLPNKNVITTSVELEKHKLENLDLLLDAADYVFISKDFAINRGFKDKLQAVKALSNGIRNGATIICPWGEDGAAAMTKGADVFSVPALKLDRVVDTLGAGDTFIASFINATLAGLSLQQCLVVSCQVAGAKCTMKGYEGLSRFSRMYI